MEQNILKYDSSIDTLEFNTAVAFNTPYLTKNGAHVSIFYIGEFRNFPFRPNKLPYGWYPRDGKLYDLTSEIGKVLNSLDSDFKSDWGIKVTDGNINVPNAFDEKGNGYFERPVDGNFRKIGSTQGDAIRNITGAFNATDRWSAGRELGAFYKDGVNNTASVNQGQNDDWLRGLAFDASRVVPTADEIRPKNVGMVPAIFLGV